VHRIDRHQSNRPGTLISGISKSDYPGVPVEIEEKKALLASSLERAADRLGDITPHVMAAYYACQPEARQRFEELQAGNPGLLEGQMVEQVLYCLMEWFDSAGEIEIILVTTVPHHIDTLHIPPSFFADLIAAVCDTIVATIPAERRGERAVWDELRRELLAITGNSAAYALTDGRGARRIGKPGRLDRATALQIDTGVRRDQPARGDPHGAPDQAGHLGPAARA